MHLCPLEMAEVVITEVGSDWFTENMYLRLLGLFCQASQGQWENSPLVSWTERAAQH